MAGDNGILQHIYNYFIGFFPDTILNSVQTNNNNNVSDAKKSENDNIDEI